MPCDIGYRNYARVAIPMPNPQDFKSRNQAPQVDADLMEKIGVNDQEFLSWLQELDIRPLLSEALKRALSKIDKGKLDFKVTSDGYLEARGSYIDAAEKKRLGKLAGQVAGQFQMEVLQIVAQLLDYETSLVRTQAEGNDVWKLQGEKNEDASVHKYLGITKIGEETEIEFEHFESAKSRDSETEKFFALAQKLGVPIKKVTMKKAGQPIPVGTVHRDFLKN